MKDINQKAKEQIAEHLRLTLLLDKASDRHYAIVTRFPELFALVYQLADGDMDFAFNNLPIEHRLQIHGIIQMSVATAVAMLEAANE